jgi:hypothetical protein
MFMPIGRNKIMGLNVFRAGSFLVLHVYLQLNFEIKTSIMEQDGENTLERIKVLAERFIDEGLFKNITLESQFGNTDLKNLLVYFHKYVEIWSRN